MPGTTSSSSDRAHVVTAFVQRPSDGAVLVVLRSDKVGSYQHKWGAISGYVEDTDASAAARARQEVLEEVGLPPCRLRLLRSGRPLRVDDGRRHFAVHPFLFLLMPPSPPEDATASPLTLQLNWENDAAQWVQPSALRGMMDTVPLLAVTYERLHMSATREAAVQRLREDRQHGAAQLAAWAVEALRQEAEAVALAGGSSSGGGGREGGAAALCAFCNFGYHLACCRPAMSPIANAVAAVLEATHDELRSRPDAFEVPLAEVCNVLQATADAELDRQQNAAAALRRQATRLLLRDGMTLMTTSLSSSVLGAVKEAAEAGMSLRAILCESRPLCEGVALAEAWAAAGVRCTVVTDAQAGLFVGRADLVLVGADAVGEGEGEGKEVGGTGGGGGASAAPGPLVAVNKVGTRLLALAAAAEGVPVAVLADSSKLAPALALPGVVGGLEALAHPGGGGQVAAVAAGAAGGVLEWDEEKKLDWGQEMAAEEVTAAWGRPVPPGVRVRNVYFEATPLRLLTAGLVTEGGRLDPSSVAAALEDRRRQYVVAFDLL